MTPEDWAQRILGVELDVRVPADVRDLFAVARGTLLYGTFLYPMYAVGNEQVHRVADAAAMYRYNDLGGSKTKKGADPASLCASADSSHTAPSRATTSSAGTPTGSCATSPRTPPSSRCRCPATR